VEKKVSSVRVENPDDDAEIFIMQSSTLTFPSPHPLSSPCPHPLSSSFAASLHFSPFVSKCLIESVLLGHKKDSKSESMLPPP